MIYLRKATEEDIIIVAANAVDGSLAARTDEVREKAKFNIANGPAFKAIFEGEAVAVAGIRLVRPGVGQIWIIISKKVEEMPFGFIKQAFFLMNKMIVELIDEFGLKKIRATSRIGLDKSQSLLEHLGFERLRRKRKENYIYVKHRI